MGADDVVTTVATMRQEFDSEGDSGVLLVYALFHDGYVMDVSDLVEIYPNSDSIAVDGNVISIAAGAGTQYGRFLTTQIECEGDVISPMTSPLINITMPMATEVDVNSCGILTLPSDPSTEFMSLPISCQISVQLHFPSNYF